MCTLLALSFRNPIYFYESFCPSNFYTFNCYQYKPKEFRKEIEMTERTLFGAAICPSAMLPDYDDTKNSIFPSFLIHDDLFQICGHFCAVSDAVNRLSERNALVSGQNVFCCVIPQRVVSLYDHDAVYQHTFGNVVQWIKSKSVKLIGRKIVKKEQMNNEM